MPDERGRWSTSDLSAAEMLDVLERRKRVRPSRNGDGPAPPPTDRAAARPPLPEYDAAELATAGAGTPLAFLPLLQRDGYFVQGWSHLLAGYPRAGKTELVTACCRDWLATGKTILYFSEEPLSIWQQRLARVPDNGAWNGMRLVLALGRDPKELLDRLRNGQESVAIVDTIRGLAVMGHDETDNSAVAGQLAPWIAAARERGTTLIFLHHMRKSDGDHGTAIAGGHALLGTVDLALELRHDASPARRLLRAYARIIQPPELMYERADDGTMRALGSPESVNLADVRFRVVQALEDEWLKTAEVRERLGDPLPSLPVLRKALIEEAQEGNIERDPAITETEIRGKTIRWRKPANLT